MKSVNKAYMYVNHRYAILCPIFELFAWKRFSTFTGQTMIQGSIFHDEFVWTEDASYPKPSFMQYNQCNMELFFIYRKKIGKNSDFLPLGAKKRPRGPFPKISLYRQKMPLTLKYHFMEKIVIFYL